MREGESSFATKYKTQPQNSGINFTKCKLPRRAAQRPNWGKLSASPLSGRRGGQPELHFRGRRGSGGGGSLGRGLRGWETGSPVRDLSPLRPGPKAKYRYYQYYCCYYNYYYYYFLLFFFLLLLWLLVLLLLLLFLLLLLSLLLVVVLLLLLLLLPLTYYLVIFYRRRTQDRSAVDPQGDVHEQRAHQPQLRLPGRRGQRLPCCFELPPPGLGFRV